MSFLIDDKDRHVIPRWRDSGTTAALGELDSLGGGRETDVSANALIEQKAAEWSEHRSVSFASDLLATAISVGSEHAAASAAADFLLGTPRASSAAKAIARRFLGHADPGGQLLERLSPTNRAVQTQDRHRRIRALKQQLREGPRNVLARVDLALEYTALGMVEQALRAMELALHLAPENRFVLRSASRLLVHVGDTDAALQVLRRSAASKHDPWLAAAEIAITGLAEGKSRLAKAGTQMLAAGTYSDFHTTELASALGTLEAESGARKKARRLFSKSLVDPTENSVAQATWAAQRLDFDEFRPSLLDVSGSFEARALNGLRSGQFSEAVQQTWKWFADQTFSKTASIFGSYLAGVALDDHEEAIRFVEAGRTANPTDWLILNNLAFSLGSLGRVDEASLVLKSIPPSADDADRIATLLATNGLLLFRKTLVSAGREFYLNAIAAFRRAGRTKAVALATILLAREEILANTQEAQAALERARGAAKTIDAPEIAACLERIERLQLLHQPR